MLLEIDNLTKKYECFTLDHVSFSLEKGYIMGFIGKNGAGKTTTLKCMIHLASPDSGHVKILDMDFAENELACKQNIGFVLGAADYYLNRKLSTIADVTRRFYSDWDEAMYRDYLNRFDLVETKRVKDLSAGMKVKFSLALALSHHAKLLILDEPTSGLDPVSRDDLLELFQEIVEDGEHSILFSTHITSDLEKCADFITYIHDGRILASEEKDIFTDRYRLVSGSRDSLTDDMKKKLIGCREHHFGIEGMIHKEDLALCDGLEVKTPTLEEIMIHIERKDKKEGVTE